jgi:hypothetical protein
MNRSLTARLATCRSAFSITVLILALLLPTLAQAEPQISFRSVPRYGSFKDLKGKVSGVKRKNYRVTVYIEVRGGWWIKPYRAQPLTKIKGNGKWTCDITTGGIDERTTTIVAYLVPAEYDPPLLAGNSTLPAELDQNSVAKAVANRTP